MKVPKNERESKVASDSIRFSWLRLSLAGMLIFAFADAASAALPDSSTINKAAQKAYCSEAKTESNELENGSVSYKHVVDVASTRALVEHPNVYRDSYAWKARIVALLDQEGDEPGQLCNRK